MLGQRRNFYSLFTRKNVTVVTNSIHHATRLVDLSIKTIIIGGYVKQTTDASIGSVALEQIRQMNFDKAFLGMNGVDEAYLTTPDMEEAVIKKQSLRMQRCLTFWLMARKSVRYPLLK